MLFGWSDEPVIYSSHGVLLWQLAGATAWQVELGVHLALGGSSGWAVGLGGHPWVFAAGSVLAIRIGSEFKIAV